MSSVLGLCENKLIQCLTNSERMGIFILCPTRSKVWEKHPMSIILWYKTETVLIATLFTAARSRMNAKTKFAGMESSAESVVISCRATSIPLQIVILPKASIDKPCAE